MIRIRRVYDQPGPGEGALFLVDRLWPRGVSKDALKGVTWCREAAPGHAPVMLPAILGRPVPFGPVFYAHLVLLHASLLARVAGGLAALPAARQWGGLLNAVAILVFVVNTASAARRGQQEVSHG